MNITALFTLLTFVSLSSISCQNHKSITLFDGHTLEGWEGNTSAFRVQDGAIIGGHQEVSLEESYYLCTTQKYSDFELTLFVKMLDEDSTENAGVSFRTKRVPESNEVAGYQADIGYAKAKDVQNYSIGYLPKEMKRPFSLWGSLVDECRADTSRYPKPHWFPVVFLEIPSRELIDSIVKPHDWNKLQIIAHGSLIEIKINDVSTVEFLENMEVPKEGCICLQAHKGAPYEVHYKDIMLVK